MASGLDFLATPAPVQDKEEGPVTHGQRPGHRARRRRDGGGCRGAGSRRRLRAAAQRTSSQRPDKLEKTTRRIPSLMRRRAPRG
ncbi:hypothetical protein TRIUR3_23130 [Triticum urartu]|uniref:Uncharacterized protein n=1 Tax=Triticum urartu TaxID=4572 RepID=M7ZWV5_TRIUA|nr:hypothetical protein TRIUR3_23130 [Triticum urartu]